MNEAIKADHGKVAIGQRSYLEAGDGSQANGISEKADDIIDDNVVDGYISESDIEIRHLSKDLNNKHCMYNIHLCNKVPFYMHLHNQTLSSLPGPYCGPAHLYEHICRSFKLIE